MIHCEKCGNEIVKSYPGGKVKLRTNIIVWESGKAFCKCQKCHSEVPIPVVLELPTGRKLKYYVLELEEVKKSGNMDKKPKKAKMPGVQNS
jgi:hypothetical protein